MKTLPDLATLDRRAKREARRAKQRRANVGRAQKMRAARIAGELKEIKQTRATQKASTALHVHIGCSGWFYWHWRSQFYPAKLATNEWFSHYAKHFNTVELNAPFYSWPTVGTVATWKRQAGRRRFIYTVKVCELITHVKQFAGTKRLIEDFGYIANVLGDRMGCFLFQLPPSFRFTPSRLKRILSQLNPALRNVVEFRHGSWWNEKVFAAFRKSGTIFCSCSGPRLPDQLIKTADDIYVRFHGTKQWYRHDYTQNELEVWADRILKSGAMRVWAYFNNDRDGFSIKNARHLRNLVRYRVGRDESPTDAAPL